MTFINKMENYKKKIENWLLLFSSEHDNKPNRDGKDVY